MSGYNYDTCSSCGKTAPQIGWFAKAFRKSELKRGRPDPGNLCGACAGCITGKRLADALSRDGGRA